MEIAEVCTGPREREVLEPRSNLRLEPLLDESYVQAVSRCVHSDPRQSIDDRSGSQDVDTCCRDAALDESMFDFDRECRCRNDRQQLSIARTLRAPSIDGIDQFVQR